tara:strand:- start:11473 stop:12033 length:561 start_codon:yes stop_codon:yes gene_type:complete
MNTEINNALRVLKEGGLILYPTDTIWGIGCDATNHEAVTQIYKLKQREDSKALICLVADDRMLKKYVKKIPKVALNIIEVTDEPTTIIYDGAQNLAKNLIAKDNTIAIRISNDDFCFNLLRRFNGAIVSTSANISDQPSPKSYSEISPEILKGVDYVVNLDREKKSTKASSIIKLNGNGMVKIIRK